MRQETNGGFRKQIGIFYSFCSFFKSFQMGLRGLWSVSNITPSFHTFWDVLDNFSYLLSLVIYREQPLRASLNEIEGAGSAPPKN